MLTFGHLLVPLVSYQDKNLSNILITTAHLPFEDDSSAAERGLVHTPLHSLLNSQYKENTTSSHTILPSLQD